MPQHKTDAIFRVFNTDRYDDRDVVLTNLLESYDRLMAFGKKHLNDTFHLDGIQSVSARDNILREIVSNLLAHRDFSNAYVAKLIIEKNCIYTENANLSHGHGVLNLATFEPFSKNPPISKVFREIGLADELGSACEIPINILRCILVESCSLLRVMYFVSRFRFRKLRLLRLDLNCLMS